MTTGQAAPFRAFRVDKTEDRRYPRSVVERTVADLPEGDLLIEVAYSSLNYKDALSATGNPGVTRNFPHTPGIDAAGTVQSRLRRISHRAPRSSLSASISG